MKKIRNFFLGKHIQKNKFLRNKVLTSIERAKSIGIICNITDEQSYKDIFALFTKLQINDRPVWLMGYIDEKNVPFYCLQQLSADYFCKKNLTWYGAPNFVQMSDFLQKEFDLLIDFTKTAFAPVRYMLALSHAKFIVGSAFENQQLYDLYIAGDDNDCAHLLKNIQFYTKIIRRQLLQTIVGNSFFINISHQPYGTIVNL